MMGKTPLQGEAVKPPVQVAAEDAELIKKIRRVLKTGTTWKSGRIRMEHKSVQGFPEIEK